MIQVKLYFFEYAISKQIHVIEQYYCLEIFIFLAASYETGVF